MDAKSFPINFPTALANSEVNVLTVDEGKVVWHHAHYMEKERDFKLNFHALLGRGTFEILLTG